MEMGDGLLHFLVDLGLTGFKQVVQVSIQLETQLPGHQAVVHFQSYQETCDCIQFKVFDKLWKVYSFLVELEKFPFFLILHTTVNDSLYVTVKINDSQ